MAPIGSASTDYYALLAENLVDVVGLFRRRRDETGLYLETWSDGVWTDGPTTLGRFVYDGEPGAEPVEPDVAERLFPGSTS